MSFKLGDYVLVLDEDLSGVVKTVKRDSVFIETEDGFLLSFNSSALVKVKSEKALKS